MKTFNSKLIDPQRLDVGFIKKWYESLPSITLSQQIKGSSSLITIVSGKEAEIGFMTPTEEKKIGGAGYVDLESKGLPQIRISTIFISNLLKAWKKDDKRFATIGACNGTVIHESLHIALTKTRTHYFGEIMTLVFNVVEDVFIEGFCSREFPSLVPFVDFKNAFLFSQAIDDFAPHEDKWANLITKTKGNFNGKILWALPFFKYFKDAQWVDFFMWIFGHDVSDDELKKAVRVCDFLMAAKAPFLSDSRREEIAKLIVELLYGHASLKTEGIDHVTEKFASDDSKGGKEEKIQTFEIDKDIEKELGINKLDRESVMKINAEIASTNSLEVSNVVEKTNIIERHPSGEINETGYIEPISYKEVGLYKRLKAFFAPKTTNGAPSEFGKLTSTRLWRSGIDGKVFSPKVSLAQQKREFSFMIMIDASGSMGHRLFSKCLETALSIKAEMLGDTCMVACHTTLYDYKDRNCLITKVAGFGEKREDIWARGNQTIKYVKLNENRDGFAVAWSAKKLMRTRGTKVLLMLSDGVPSDIDYRGPQAVKHTMEMISNARKEGIVVIAISLAKSVVGANESIYGAEYHVDGCNSAKLGESIANKIMSLQGERR